MMHIVFLIFQFLAQWRTLAILLALLNLKVLPLAWHVSLHPEYQLSQAPNRHSKDSSLLRFLLPLLLRSSPRSKIYPHIPHTLRTYHLHLRSTIGRVRLQSPQIKRHILYRSRYCARTPYLLPLSRRRQQIRIPEIIGIEHGLNGLNPGTAKRALHHGTRRSDLYVQTGAETLSKV